MTIRCPGALLLSLCLLLERTLSAQAVLASPFPFDVQQADGSNITLFVRGNEYLNYYEDKAGYPVVMQKALLSVSGEEPAMFYYATLAGNGQLQATQHAVGSVDPATLLELSPHVAPSIDAALLDSDEKNGNSFVGGVTSLGLYRRRSGHEHNIKRAVTTGPVNNFVLLIRWSDSPFGVSSAANNFTGLPSMADLDNLFNGPANSLRDVYLKNSYGQLLITSIFSDWITVSMTQAQAAAGQSGLGGGVLQAAIREALTAAQSRGIDFSQFDKDGDGRMDMFSVLHSGYAAEWGGADYASRIWSHKWSLPAPWVSMAAAGGKTVAVTSYHVSPAIWGMTGTRVGRIGVIAHETGHFLGMAGPCYLTGLPDLYDVDGPSGVGTGLGSYSLMANSWGFDGSQNFPPLMDGWSKSLLKWVVPTPITTAGTYSINALADFPQVYMISQGFPDGEYLLIENRQPVSYDEKMPMGGLAIYHVDMKTRSLWTQGWPQQAGWPQNGNHYRVALLQADGLYQLESTSQRGDRGDLWSTQGPSSELNGATLPSTNSYQGGIIQASGVSIVVTSGPQTVMTFTVEFDEVADPPAVTETCVDGIQNNGETGVDCGGPCAACPTTCQSAGVKCTVAPRTLLRTDAPCIINTNCTVAACCRDLCATFPERSPCNDGNSLTTGDTCLAGVCRGSTACRSTGVTCAAGNTLSTTRNCTPGVNCNVAQCCVPVPTSTARTTTTTAAATARIGVLSIVISSPAIKASTFQGVATIRIVNSSGRAVLGAQVTGVFQRNSGRISETVSGLTATSGGSLGNVTLRTRATWTTFDKTLRFCVRTVTRAGFTYNTTLNRVTCITVPTTRTGREVAMARQQ